MRNLFSKKFWLAILLVCGCIGLTSVASSIAGFTIPLVDIITANNSAPAIEFRTFLPFISSQCLCYYVDSNNGSDTNSGTSIDKPWRTLAPVNAARFQPGTRVHFKRGSSWTGTLEIDDSGAQGNPIIFTLYGTGEKPVFMNPAATNLWRGIVVIRASWVTVEGLLIRDSKSVGVSMSDSSSHNILRDLEITGTGWGISASGQYHLITRNYIHDLQLMTNTPGGTDDGGAVAIGVFGSHSEFSYNRMVNCIAPSYDWGMEGGGFELFGRLNNNYIHHNWTENVGGFMELGGSPGVIDNTTVAYNVFVNAKWFFYVNLTAPYTTSISNLRIENNTIVATNLGWALFHFGQGALPPVSATLIRNNIVYLTRSGGVVANKPNFIHSHNLYFLGAGNTLGDNNNWTPAQLDPTEKIANPLFVNLVGNDLHLQATSPAINAGTNLGYALDFDDRPVPVGIAPDMGAFEYSGN